MAAPPPAGSSKKTLARQKNRSDKKDRDRIRNKSTFRQVANYYAVCELCRNPFVGDPVYHHIDPNTKKGAVSSMAGQPLGLLTVQLEMLKCRIICKVCHDWLSAEADIRYPIKLAQNALLPVGRRKASRRIKREVNCELWFEKMSVCMVSRGFPALP